MPKPPPRVQRTGPTGAAWRWRRALGWATGLLLLAGLVQLVADTPWLLLALACGPAALCAAAVIRLDRRAHAPRRLLAGAFLWGAVVAPAIAVALNGALRGALAGVADGAAATRLATTFGAPLVEEASKAAALLLLVVAWRDELRGVRDGIVYGALVGIGFTMAENLFYFAAALLVGGAAGLAESVYLRAALGGLTHATFSATTGAGVGWARARGAAGGGWIAVAVGFALAVAQHAVWNGLGADWLQTAPCAPGAAARCRIDGRLWYWLIVAPGIVGLCIAPGLAALMALARRGERR